MSETVYTAYIPESGFGAMCTDMEEAARLTQASLVALAHCLAQTGVSRKENETMKERITQVTLLRDKGGIFVAFYRKGMLGRPYKITAASLKRLSRALNSSLVLSGRYYPRGNGWDWYRMVTNST